MKPLPVKREKEELLLLAVSVGAAALGVASILRPVPSSPTLPATSAVALALSLVSALAFWLAAASRRAMAEQRHHDHDVARQVLAAVPEGLLLLGQGERLLSVNTSFCDLLGFERDELVGCAAPFPFWPPEHRHELERWHDALANGDQQPGQLVFSHRSGARIPVLVAGGRIAIGSSEPIHVLSVRDVSLSHRREQRLRELSSRDPETALLNERGFEEWLRETVRKAIAGSSNVSVALLELAAEQNGRQSALRGRGGQLVVDRLQALMRAGEIVARTRTDELAWILPGADVEAAVKAVARARDELQRMAGITVTAGVCDLGTARDSLALYALADRALAEARRRGPNVTACYPERDS